MTNPQFIRKKREIADNILESGSRLVRFVQLPIIIGAGIIILFIMGETLTMAAAVSALISIQ